MKILLGAGLRFLVIFAFLGGTAIAQEADGVLAKRLLGQWQEFRVVDCEGHQQVISIAADGSFEVKGVIHACDGKTPFTWRGKWRVEGGKFHYVTTFSEPATLYAAGEKFADQILSVSATEWVMIEQSTGNKSVAYRIR